MYNTTHQIIIIILVVSFTMSRRKIYVILFWITYPRVRYPKENGKIFYQIYLSPTYITCQLTNGDAIHFHKVTPPIVLFLEIRITQKYNKQVLFSILYNTKKNLRSIMAKFFFLSVKIKKLVNVFDTSVQNKFSITGECKIVRKAKY